MPLLDAQGAGQRWSEEMQELTTLVEIAIAASLVAAPAVAIVRALDDGSSIAALFGLPAASPWPQGVQEEEPRPWGLTRTPAPAGAGA